MAGGGGGATVTNGGASTVASAGSGGGGIASGGTTAGGAVPGAARIDPAGIDTAATGGGTAMLPRLTMLATVTAFVCVTGPLLPGLAIRIDTFRLHWVQLAGAVGAAPGGSSEPQSHCQFHTQVVAPGAGVGTGAALEVSQFQAQFHTQTFGAVVGVVELPVWVVPGEFWVELSGAVLPLISGVGVGVAGFAGEGTGCGAGCPSLCACAGVCELSGVAEASGFGDTTAGITADTGCGCCGAGVAGAAAGAGTTGGGGVGADTVTVGGAADTGTTTGGVGTTTGGAGTTTGGTTGAGGIGTGGPPSASARDGPAAANVMNAATTTHQRDRRHRYICEGMYPPVTAAIQKCLRIPFRFADETVTIER